MTRLDMYRRWVSTSTLNYSDLSWMWLGGSPIQRHAVCSCVPKLRSTQGNFSREFSLYRGLIEANAESVLASSLD